MASDIDKWRREQEKKGFHKCLLCPCYIRESEVYCSSCGQEVWAVRSNAEDHGGKWAKEWAALQKKIEGARHEKQKS